MAKKLTIDAGVQRMLHASVKSHGLVDGLAMIEESLTGNEYDAIEVFYKWLKKKGRSFGWNIAEVVKDWENDQ